VTTYLPPVDKLRERVAELVAVTSSDGISAAVALEPGSTLTDKGMTSLGYLRLIDAIETEFGIYVDLEADSTFLETVHGIAQRISDEVGAP
jgi:acyl carrier protein